MKRIAYRFFLIVLLSVLAVEVFPVSAQEDSWFDEGNYDEEWLDKNFDNDVMIISTPEEFAAWGAAMNRWSWNYPDKTVRLAVDIDMSAHKWITPVNERFGSYFSGVFDGDGYTISGLMVVPAEEGGGYSDDYKRVAAGLFGEVRRAEIRDLTLDETCRVEVSGIYYFSFGDLDLEIGAIAAVGAESRFIRCVNRADVVVTSAIWGSETYETICSVSGIVAHADDVKLIGCSNEGHMTIDVHSDVVDIRVSGLVGRCGPVYGNENRIVSCTNWGNIFVSGNTSGSVSVGGISSNYSFRVDSCENHSVVKVNAYEGSAYVGGVSSASMGITYCFNRDSVICESDGFEVQVGGVCSNSTYNSSQTDSLYTCGNEGEIEVKSNGSMLSVGGVMGQNTDCLIVDCWNRGGLKIESSAPRSSSSWNAIYAGGLVGYCEEPVYNSYNRGNISLIDAHIDEEGSSQGSVGGLVGKAYKLLWNSYSTGDVYSDVAGVKVCRLSESNVHSCYYNSDAVVEGTEVGENGIAYSTAEMQSAGSGFLDALNNAVKGDAVCRNWGYIPGENNGYPVHVDRIVDGVDSPADHSVGRVYAANGRLFVQSDRSMQLPVYKVTGQIVKIMNVVEGLNTDYLPCGVYVVAGQVVAVTAGNK
ncbi:hypothetical protein [Barnesiella intestinihominis]|uniref:hypothetical protein n=1 Tax=Barnesiella intestinihominis TaxID=487174 RepID=UPI0026DD6061|nr:hypothetical protein [Barnesiella intestinihominis]